MKIASSSLSDVVRRETSFIDPSKFASLEVGQIVPTLAGPVFRVISKTTGADAIVIRLANLAGKPVDLTAEKFAALQPISPLFARIAARFRFLGSISFNAVVHEALKQAGIPADPKMNWDGWFQTTYVNRLYNNTDIPKDDKEMAREVAQEVAIKELWDRGALSKMEAAYDGPNAWKPLQQYKNLPLAQKASEYLKILFGYRYSDAVEIVRRNLSAVDMPAGRRYKCEDCGKEFFSGAAKANLECPKCHSKDVKVYGGTESIYQENPDEGPHGGMTESEEYNVLNTPEHATAPNQETELQWEDINRFSKLFENYLKEQRSKQAKGLIILYRLVLESAEEDTEKSHSKRNLYSKDWEKATGLGHDAFKGYLQILQNLFLQFVEENPDFEDKFEIVRVLKHQFADRFKDKTEQQEEAVAAPKASSLHLAEEEGCLTCLDPSDLVRKINHDEIPEKASALNLAGVETEPWTVEVVSDKGPNNYAVVGDGKQQTEAVTETEARLLADEHNEALKQAEGKTAAPDLTGVNPSDAVAVAPNNPDERLEAESKSMPSTRTSPGASKRTVAPEIPQVKHGANDLFKFNIDDEKSFNVVMEKFGQIIDWEGDTMVAPRKYKGGIEELVNNSGGIIEDVDDIELTLKQSTHEDPTTDTLCCANYPECDCSQLAKMKDDEQHVADNLNQTDEFEPACYDCGGGNVVPRDLADWPNAGLGDFVCDNCGAAGGAGDFGIVRNQAFDPEELNKDEYNRRHGRPVTSEDKDAAEYVKDDGDGHFMALSGRVQINEGSGVNSGKQGEIISWNSPDAQKERYNYPFVGGRTPESMGWVAIKLDSGRVTSVPKNNIKKIAAGPEEDVLRGDPGLIREQYLTSPEAPQKPWFCLDCNMPVDLDRTGRCEQCGSEAVDVVSHGKRPEGVYPAPLDEEKFSASKSVNFECMECGKKFRSASDDPRCPKCSVDLEVGDVVLPTKSATDSQFVEGDIYIGRPSGGGRFEGTFEGFDEQGNVILHGIHADRLMHFPPSAVKDAEAERSKDEAGRRLMEEEIEQDRAQAVERERQQLRESSPNQDGADTPENWVSLAEHIKQQPDYELTLDINPMDEKNLAKAKAEYAKWTGGESLNEKAIRLHDAARSYSWVLKFKDNGFLDYPLDVRPRDPKHKGIPYPVPTFISVGNEISLQNGNRPQDVIGPLVRNGLRMRKSTKESYVTSSATKIARDLNETMEWTDGHTYRLTTWQERDNFTIILVDETEDKEIMHLVDEDAVAFIEDGFFDWKQPIQSCLEHAEEMGMINTPRNKRMRKGSVDQADWDAIRPGDRLTILVPGGMGRNGREWSERSGRVVMRSATGGWVLNMGGPHGTPGLADLENTVKIIHKKAAVDDKGHPVEKPTKSYTDTGKDNRKAVKNFVSKKQATDTPIQLTEGSSYKIASIRFKARREAKVAGPIDWMKSKTWPTQLVMALATLLITAQGADALKTQVAEELQNRGKEVPAQLQPNLPKSTGGITIEDLQGRQVPDQIKVVPTAPEKNIVPLENVGPNGLERLDRA
jgi:DNA-directed RNA polymerase subunit RPC12/RpoP